MDQIIKTKRRIQWNIHLPKNLKNLPGKIHVFLNDTNEDLRKYDYCLTVKITSIDTYKMGAKFRFSHSYEDNSKKILQINNKYKIAMLLIIDSNNTIHNAEVNVKLFHFGKEISASLTKYKVKCEKYKEQKEINIKLSVDNSKIDDPEIENIKIYDFLQKMSVAIGVE